MGICTRTQGPSLFVEVRAQSIEGEITDISSSSHKLFGNNGEIEVRSARPAVKVGDWVQARPALEGPPKRQRYVASAGRRLLPFEDLSGLYAPEAARRLLVETGRQDGFAGDRVFRIGASDIIEVRMMVAPDGRSRIGQPEDLTALPIWPYQAERHIRVPTPAGLVDLFAWDAAVSKSGVVNWCSDVEFVRHVIGSFADASADDDVLKQAAALLSGHVEKLESVLSKAEQLDPRVGQEIMRSRKLADLLKSRDAMLKDFMGVLRSDPEVKAQLSDRTEQIAREAAEVRIEELVRNRTAALQVELDERRVRGHAELDETLREIEASELAAVTARLRSAEDTALMEISTRKMEVEAEVGRLTERRAEIADQSVAEGDHLVQTRKQLIEAEKELATRKEEIDRIVRMESVLQDRRSGAAHSGKPRVPGFRPADPAAKLISFGGLAAWVEDCKMLSAAGKAQCLRALADVCAGGLPVFTGDQTDDFIGLIAAAVGGGSFVSFDCDPTVITFDDLWVRPGSGSSTSLGEALAACDEAGTVRFCVIRNVDRAAAHLWLDTLADKLRRREIPDGMLVCLTLAGAPSETLGEAIKRLLSVDTTGSMEKAAAITALTQRGDERFERQIDLATLERVSTAAIAEAVGKLLVKEVHVGFADAEWLCRLVAVAKALLKEQADEFIVATAKRRMPAPKGGSPSNGKPGLRVIESGGTSNA